jgi:hypothetical protein
METTTMTAVEGARKREKKLRREDSEESGNDFLI